MSEGKNVYAAIAAVMAAVGAVGKNRQNIQGGGYKYRGIDDVMAAVQPIMAEHGLICVPRVVEREREHITTNKGSGMVSVRLLVEHTFFGPDGTFVICTTLGEAFDSGDKASNKAMAVALKYALTETLMIPTYEADRDTEEQSPEIAPRQQHRPPPNGQRTEPPGREPGADDGPGEDIQLVDGIAKARNMGELRALVGLRDRVTAKNTKHPLWTKFVERYRALEAQQKGQAA